MFDFVLQTRPERPDLLDTFDTALDTNVPTRRARRTEAPAVVDYRGRPLKSMVAPHAERARALVDDALAVVRAVPG